MDQLTVTVLTRLWALLINVHITEYSKYMLDSIDHKICSAYLKVSDI